MLPESRAADVREIAYRSPANVSTRSRRFRFSLRTLLLAPILVGALLLCVFPKIVTGDYANVTITNIRGSGRNLRIEMATTRSAGTGIGAEIPDVDSLGILVSGSDCRGWFPTWPGWIPTWPRHGRTSITFTLGFLGNDDARGAHGNLASLLAVRIGETYCVTRGAPLKLLVAQEGLGRRDQCTLRVSRGSRLGFKP